MKATREEILALDHLPTLGRDVVESGELASVLTRGSVTLETSPLGGIRARLQLPRP